MLLERLKRLDNPRAKSLELLLERKILASDGAGGAAANVTKENLRQTMSDAALGSHHGCLASLSDISLVATSYPGNGTPHFPIGAGVISKILLE